MANPKKNTMNQILFTMVDKTDFATIESGALAASMVGKYFGVNHGGSTVSTSGTISKAVSQVASGVYRQTLKAAECNYDEVLYRFYHPSCALQFIPILFETINDVDNSATLSNIQSYLAAMSGMLSDVQSGVAAIESRVPSAITTTSDLVSKVWANATAQVLLSNVSDIQSYLVAMSAMDSDIHSQALRTYSRVLLAASNISDVQSYCVALSATLSDVQSYLVGMSAMLSDTHSQAARGYSRTLLNASVISDVQSYLIGLSANVSDVYSAVQGIGGTGTYSRLMLVASNMSDVQSYLVGMSGMLSDTYSAVKDINVNLAPSDVSAIASQTAAAVGSSISDVQSYLLDISNMISQVQYRVDHNYSRAMLTASTVSDIQSYLVGMSAMESDTQSAARQANSRALVMQSAVSDLDSAMTSQYLSTSGMISDLYSHVDVAIASDLAAFRGTTAISELGVGQPTATPTLDQAIALLYMAVRNRSTETATQLSIHNDAGTTIAKAVTSDDGTTFTRHKLISG